MEGLEFFFIICVDTRLIFVFYFTLAYVDLTPYLMVTETITTNCREWIRTLGRPDAARYHSLTLVSCIPGPPLSFFFSDKG